MKRSEFFRNIAAGVAALAIAPKIEASPIEFNPRAYELVKTKNLWQESILHPNSVRQGQWERHTLCFDKNPNVPISSVLMDENRFSYLVVAVATLGCPGAEVMVIETRSNQRRTIGIRSRRRGLLPRKQDIGKEFVVYLNAYQENG